MGGGISLVEGVEELMTATYLIGRSVQSISFPGMYRIYDFQSAKAPKIKIKPPRFIFGPDSDEDDADEDEDEDEENRSDPSQYKHLFHVKVGNDTIYIDNVLEANDAGWTPLHACCLSYNTVDAGIAIIHEVVRLGGDLDGKTKLGPGTFNKGWTALHMACAYGIEPLVETLVQFGADVNARNTHGYSCLLEACHRGFINIVKALLTKPVDLKYIPDDSNSMNSPFSSAPSQSALGETARCGFFKVVQSLLEAGAPKDQRNRIGWTPLHEACFYNRMETTKTLLLHGANPTLRTKLGALPYHLAGIPEIRAMLESMGGSDAVPAEDDRIDMVAILTELTNCPVMIIQSTADGVTTIMSSEDMSRNDNNKQHQDSKDQEEEIPPVKSAMRKPHGSMLTNSGRGDGRGDGDTAKGLDRKGSEEDKCSPALLHSGGLLGDLPAFDMNPSSGGMKASGSPSHRSAAIHRDLDVALSMNDGSSTYRHPNFLNSNQKMNAAPLRAGNASFMSNYQSSSAPSRKADEKKKKKKNRDHEVPKDIPQAYLCALTQKPMSEPMRSIYGHVYDKTAIMKWFVSQGKICPLTGAPLSDIDLTPAEELGNEIREWILERGKKSSKISVEEDVIISDEEVNKVNNSTIHSATEEDLYDF